MASVIKAGNATDGVQVTSDNTGILELKTGTGAGTTAMTIGTDQSVTFAGAVSSSGNQTVTGNLTVDGNTTLGNANTDTILMTAAPSIGGAGLGMGFGFRNRIINGNMVIDQRNAGASVTPTATGAFVYTIDRWAAQISQASRISVQQNAGSVTPPTGFSNYLGVTSLAATSVGAGDYFLLRHGIEGFNTSDLAWGTANAQTVTLSFLVRSSLTGTFGGSIQNSAQSNSYAFTYSIPVANTWTSISVTIPGPTSGTWVGATNGIGLQVFWGLGVGSTYSGAAGSWTNALVAVPTGSVSVVGTNGATFYITGVQLEKGSTATSFDYRPYSTELQLAQRYYSRLSSLSGNFVGFGSGVVGASAVGTAYVKYPVRMRATPTLGQSGTAVYDGSTQPVTSLGTVYYGDESLFANLNVASGLTGGRGCAWIGNNNATAYIDLSAEL